MAGRLLETVRDAAQTLREELNRLLAECDGWNASEQAEYLERPVATCMNACLEKLAATGCIGPANQLPSQVLWEVAGDLLEQGALQLRAREKPRGYAGDDELLCSIFRGELAASPLGRAFDQFFLQQDAPQAVIARTMHAAGLCEELLRNQVADRACRIAVIGAGPALEIEQALHSGIHSRQQHQVTLLDLDEQALVAAQQRLAHIAPEVELIALRENLFRLGKQPHRAKPLGDSDLIICLGLLDYLKAEDAAALLRVCHQSLRPGGRMLFGNFSPTCQARSYMEWIGNWYLTYRNEQEFMALAQSAGMEQPNCRTLHLVEGACLLLEVGKE